MTRGPRVEMVPIAETMPKDAVDVCGLDFQDWIESNDDYTYQDPSTP